MTIWMNTFIHGNLSYTGQHRITYQAIPSGADLNDYITPGYYRSSSVGNTFTNKPAACSNAFELVITSIETPYCTQTIKPHNNNKRWTRTQVTWTTPQRWTDWEEIRVGNGSLTASSLSLTTPLAIASGGTGGSTAGAAQRALKVSHEYTEITASSADDWLTKALAYILTEAQNTGWNTFIAGSIAWAGGNIGYYTCVVYSPTMAMGVQIINPSAYGVTWWTYWNGTWTRRKPS